MNSNNTLPELEKLEIAEIYDLNSFHYEFGNQTSEHNLEVLDQIQTDFSKKYDINIAKVKKAFEIETILFARSTENLLVIFKHGDSEVIEKYFFNTATRTFEILKMFRAKKAN